ncbi:MAG: DUF2339 domain-containing protein [Flavobacteriales bacterium]
MICKHCSSDNLNNVYFCGHCHKLLYSPDFTISRLQLKLDQIQSKHNKEISEIREELYKVQNYILKVNEVDKPEVIQRPKPVVLPYQKPESAPIKEVTKPISPEEITKNAEQKTKEEVKEVKITQSNTQTDKEEVVQTYKTVEPVNKPIILEEPKEPSKLWLAFQDFISPLYDGLDLITETYSNYKKEGKLPIFFMTIGGILAILFGVGYFLPMSFEMMGDYGEIVKLGLSLVFSLAIGFFGMRLHKKDGKYQEYSSALISLCLSLNYLIVYFFSTLLHFPALSSAQFGFFLIVANTGLALWAAFTYKTKIISVLSLLGGALSPLFLHASGNPDFYFTYLLLLIASANFIALKIKWFHLNYISFVLFLVLTESNVIMESSHSVWFIFLLHGFAYLFFYIVLFRGKRLKQDLTKIDLVILAGNLSVFLFNLYDCIPNFKTLGFIYLANGVIFSLLLVKTWSSITKNLKISFFISIGSFIGLAIPFLLGQSLMGLFWSIEAIALITLGFTYKLYSIRKEGYIILTIAIGKLLFSSYALIVDWDSTIFHNGLINYILFGGVITLLWVISLKNKAEFTLFEQKLFAFILEILPLWMSSVVFIFGFYYLELHVLNLMMIPMLGLFFWTKKFDTISSNFFGFLHFIFLFAAIGLSFSEVNSFRFTHQTLGGKIGLIEVILCFGFLKLLFEQLKFTTKTSYKLAYALRVLFLFTIPIIFAKQIHRHLEAFFVSSVWISMMITYLLHKKFKHRVLFFEFFLIGAAALCINVYNFSLLSIGIGILTLLALLFLEKVQKPNALETSKYQIFLYIIPFIISGLIGFALYKLNICKPDLAFIISSLLLAVYYQFHKVLLVFQTKQYGIMVSLAVGIAGAFLSWNSNPSLLNLIFILILALAFSRIFYIYQNASKANHEYKIQQESSFLLFSLWMIWFGLLTQTLIHYHVGFVSILLAFGVLIVIEKKKHIDILLDEFEQNLSQNLHFILFPLICILFVFNKLITLPSGILLLAFLINAISIYKIKVYKTELVKSHFIAIFGLTFIGAILLNSYESNIESICAYISILILSLSIGYVLIAANKTIKCDWFPSLKSLVLISFQIIIILAYTKGIMLSGLDIEGPLTTIALVLHAIIALFNALKFKNKLLNKTAVVLFVLALAKLIIYDIKGFSTNSKILVLIVLGVLLLGASYLYVKLKNKYQEKDQD